MRPSSVPARIITAAIGVIITPVALGLLNLGGQAWYYQTGMYGGSLDVGALVGPTLLQVLGIALLIGVVLTGLWSSAGLLAAGALSVVPLVLSIAPALLMETYRIGLPRELVDGIFYGAPTVVLPALGAMGLSLFLTRRARAASPVGLTVVGLIVSPVLLLAGAWLVTWGIGTGVRLALVRYQLDFAPLAALSLVGGLVLIIAGVVATRWSPFALVLPAIALLVGTLVLVIGGVPMRAALYQSSRDASEAQVSLFIMGTATAVGLMYLAFTAVLLVTRRRLRRAGPMSVGRGVGYPAGGAGAAAGYGPYGQAGAGAYGQPGPAYAPPGRAPERATPVGYGQPGQAGPAYGQSAPAYGQPGPDYGQATPAAYGQSAPAPYGQALDPQAIYGPAAHAQYQQPPQAPQESDARGSAEQDPTADDRTDTP